MNERPSKDLLRRLTLAPGPPGGEDAVREIVREQLKSVGKLSYDRLGSVICEKKGSAPGPRVMLEAHMDEVGFMVQSVTAEGLLKFVPLGGWWGHVLLGQRLDILTRSGTVPGVIGAKPPHFLSGAERNKVVPLDEMYIDVGASGLDEVVQLGIQVGDPAVPRGEWIEMRAEGVLSSKAFDNRVGVGLLCETLGALEAQEHPNTVVGVAAVQEEVGCRGATTASAGASPDVAVVLEGAPADDLPGFTERQGALGGGPQVRLFDPTAISNRRLVRFVEEVARDEKIEIQLAVRRSGGTDARSIHTHELGVPTVVVGVPSRYIHTHSSLIQWRDYVAAGRLVLKLMERLDRKTVASLTDFER